MKKILFAPYIALLCIASCKKAEDQNITESKGINFEYDKSVHQIYSDNDKCIASIVVDGETIYTEISLKLQNNPRSNQPPLQGVTPHQDISGWEKPLKPCPQSLYNNVRLSESLIKLYRNLGPAQFQEANCNGIIISFPNRTRHGGVSAGAGAGDAIRSYNQNNPSELCKPE